MAMARGPACHCCVRTPLSTPYLTIIRRDADLSSHALEHVLEAGELEVGADAAMEPAKVRPGHWSRCHTFTVLMYLAAVLTLIKRLVGFDSTSHIAKPMSRHSPIALHVWPVAPS